MRREIGDHKFQRCVVSNANSSEKSRTNVGNIGSCNVRTAQKTREKQQAAMEEINAIPNRNVGIAPFNVTQWHVNLRDWGVVETEEYKRNSCMQISKVCGAFARWPIETLKGAIPTLRLRVAFISSSADL